MVGVEVLQGQITVNSVALVADEPTCKVLEADCRAKYGEVIGVSSGDGATTIILGATEHTLYAEEGAGPTEIRITGLDGPWLAIAEYGRYSVHICAWLPDEDPSALFWRE